jgi:2,3-bisphosphoglycerate-independent phosphoglycerate mutase
MDITRIELMIRGRFLLASSAARRDETRAHRGRKLPVRAASDGGFTRRRSLRTKMAKQKGVDRVFVHAFMDDATRFRTERDTRSPTKCASTARGWSPVSADATTVDRDRRWERILKAYNAMVFGQGEGGLCRSCPGRRILQQGHHRRVQCAVCVCR